MSTRGSSIVVAVIGVAGGGIDSTVDALFYQKNKSYGRSKSDKNQFREMTATTSLHGNPCTFVVLQTPEVEPYASETLIASNLSTIETFLLNGCKKYGASSKPHYVLFVTPFNATDDFQCKKFSKIVQAFNIISGTLYSTLLPSVLFVLTGANGAGDIATYQSIIKSYCAIGELPFGSIVVENPKTASESLWKCITSAMKLHSSTLEEACQTLQNGVKSGNAAIRMVKDDSLGVSLNPLSQDRVDRILNQLSTGGGASTGRSIVRAQLREAWDELRMKRADPNLLNRILYVFDAKKITTNGDVPKTKSKIASLVSRLPPEENIALLLRTAFGIEIPCMDVTEWQLASGYDAFKCKFVQTSIFQLDSSTCRKICPWGYLIPKEFKCKHVFDIVDVFKSVPSFESYVDMRNHDIGVLSSGAIEVDLDIDGSHDTSVASGYNILPYKKEEGRQYSFLRELRLYELELDYSSSDLLKLKPDFLKKINSLPAYTADNSEVEEKYRKFFKEYGTHIITKCYGGGQIEMNGSFESSYSLTKFTNLRMDSWIFFPYWWSTYVWRLQFLENNLRKLITGMEDSPCIAAVAEMTFHTGVNSRKPNPTDFNSIEHIREGWLKDAYNCPMTLSTNCDTVSISDYINGRQDIDEEIKVNVKRAYQSLFLSHGHEGNYTSCGIGSYLHRS